MKILIVEDDHDLLQVLRTMLEWLGHEVVTAADGEEGWAAYGKADFPVVITDRLMPRMDGLELCSRIRAERRDSYTYVMLVTVLGGKDSFLEGMEAGADDFIAKPVDREELRARLRVAERLLSLQRHVARLERLLPICVYCKKIRDERGHWTRIEHYLAARTQASFSHGVCPDCNSSVVKPELERLRGMA
jgi:DNA-binding response OmpR family regulator